MSFFKELRRRVHYWRNREQLSRELEEELQFHLEQKATRADRIQFGNTTQLKEEARAVWIASALDNFLTDIRYTIRGSRKSPAFAAIAIGTLALGMGAGTAIFALAEAVLIKPLPFPNPDELTLVFEAFGPSRYARSDTAPGTYRALRESMKTLRDLAVFQPIETNITGAADPERVDGAAASANLFSMLGIQPHLGRFFREGEDLIGMDDVVVLGFELWQRRYAADPALVNKTIYLSERPYTVIGVLPPNFRFHANRAELWVPFAISPERWASRGSRYVYVAGRLNAGASIQQVQFELDGLAAQFRRDFPRDNSTLGLEAVSLPGRVAEDSRTSLYFLLAAVVALLLIACSNVANLLLTRSVAREAELSVRAALGASSGRLLRQLLTESLTLALAAGVLGLFIAHASFRLLQPLVPSGIASFTQLQLNAKVVGIMFALALASTLACGLIPALRGARSLATRAIGGRHHERTRGALIVAEVALAILLLTGAALLFRTFTNLNNVDPGFRADHLISAQTVLPPKLYKEHALRSRFYSDVLERVKSIPGVTHGKFVLNGRIPWRSNFESSASSRRRDGS